MMRDYDDDYEFDGAPYVVIERRDSGISTFLMGLALGAGAALLFAPRSGADTRRIIRDRARSAGDAARRRADGMVESVTATLEDARERFTEQVDAVRAAVREQRDEIVDAFDAGRSAAHEARLELERKIAEQKQARREGKVS